MSFKKFYIIIISILLVISFFTGCASTSNVTRYGEKKESETHKTNNVRFTSGNDENDKNIATSGKNDSVAIQRSENDSDSDDLPANEPIVDISSVLKKISPNKSGNSSSDNETPKERMLMEIIKYINTPYKYGGSSHNGIDCSAFTQAVFSKSLEIKLDRTARGQYHEGQEINDVNDLQFGDLVFFNTSRREKPGHVGIYIGDHLFVHAARSGVTVSSLDMDYYSKRFMGGRRIEPDEFGSR
jgi:cell wall-associated NlpC family hydrolase